MQRLSITKVLYRYREVRNKRSCRGVNVCGQQTCKAGVVVALLQVLERLSPQDRFRVGTQARKLYIRDTIKRKSWSSVHNTHFW